ncbi:MAG: hypothetical protein P4L33_21025 [Capsulimonadaceae bacterium]|nr:hypothetical protein [Capsulimonadaceae bacterium]
MNFRTSLAAAVCLGIACVTPVFAGQYTENFTAPAKADGSIAGWTLPSSGFTVKPGMLVSDGSSDKQIATWSAPPVGTSITYTANVTPTATPGTDWSVAGIGIILDDQNYWHLAIVKAPTSANLPNFAELSEMKDGNWNAQGTAPTNLVINNDVPGFVWKTGVTYQFKITLTPTQIQGQILDGGVVKFSCSDQLSSQAISKGRPMVDFAGINANFTSLSANVLP